MIQGDAWNSVRHRAGQAQRTLGAGGVRTMALVVRKFICANSCLQDMAGSEPRASLEVG